mmetsp:Transcript_17095/g.42714  ORF Transcript_17095/g.42714 Transcript_17095/m.42714 type:complete len:80 (-) Transcript_17095:996-1235(-)
MDECCSSSESCEGSGSSKSRKSKRDVDVWLVGVVMLYNQLLCVSCLSIRVFFWQRFGYSLVLAAAAAAAAMHPVHGNAA